MRKTLLLLSLFFFACFTNIEYSRAQTCTTKYSDDFNATLANWNNPTGQGSWTISGGKLIGYYNITCGSTTCPQADLILNDQYQISDNWKATSTFSKFFSHSYGGNVYGNNATFTLWVNSSNKIAVSLGEYGVDLTGLKDSLAVGIQKWNGSWSYTALPGASKTGKFKYPGGTWNADGTNTASIQKNGTSYKLYFNDLLITEFNDSFLTGTVKIGYHCYGSNATETFKLDSCSYDSKTKSLIAYYPFDGNANDASGYTNNGILNGPTLTNDRFGNLSKAYQFSTSYISVPDAPRINPTGEISISFWVNSTQTDPGIPIAKRLYNGAIDYLVYLNIYESGKIGFMYTDNLNVEHTYSTSNLNKYNDGNWHNISLIYKSGISSSLKIYLDGIYCPGSWIGGNGAGNLADRNSELMIGRQNVITENAGFVNGKIDDIRMYNRALSATEISTLYTENNWPLSAPVRDLDGNTYDTVKIGTQIWMKQNLKTTKYNDGTSIPNVTDNTAWAALTTPAYSWYNNDAASNKNVYGGLYNWYAVNTGKLCPTGWHVPSDAEWLTLESYLGGSSIVSPYLRDIIAGGTNSSGFSALLGGDRFYSSGAFSYLTLNGYWWKSTSKDEVDAYYTHLTNSVINVGHGVGSQKFGLSVRCLKDGPTSGLVASYPFNGNANDESGNGNNGTINGATPADDRFGNANSAYSFDGISSYISVANSAALNSPVISISLWTNYQGGSYNPRFFSKTEGSGATYQLYDYKSASGGIGIGIDESGFSTGYFIPINSWTHFVMIRENDSIRLFVNGVQVSSKYKSGTLIGNSGNLVFGANGSILGSGLDYLLGTLDDIRIYNKALTKTEISNLYHENGWPQSASVIDMDGNTYDTVKIGTQTWMKQNLKTTKYNDDSSIPNVTDNVAWGNLATPAYCWYNNDEASNRNVYGALYNWYTVNTGKLCPAGWRVPTDSEIKTLEMHLGLTQAEADAVQTYRGTDQGNKLKEAGNVHWTSPSSGNNNSGFTALPSAYRDVYGGAGGFFYNLTNVFCWWSATEYDASWAWYRYLINTESGAGRDRYYKKNGYSVRCLKDDLSLGLVASYPFNGNSNDESGNGNNGTNNGAILTTDRFAASNKAYSFNGTTNYIAVANNSIFNFGTGDFTVSAFIKTSNIPTTSWSAIIGKHNTSTSHDTEFFLMIEGSTGKPYFGLSTNAGVFERVYGTANVCDNKFHQITGIKANGQIHLYVDGLLVASASSTINPDNSNPINIGRSSYNGGYGYFNGIIDEVRIYNRSLASTEIDALYHEGSWSLPPTITSFTPTSGAIGTTVTITGDNFDSTPANNIVWFGATKATVKSATATELVVTVPTGANYQPISVTTTLNGLTGYSMKPFIVTFPSTQVIDASTFETKVTFNTGTQPFYNVSGDLDGDSKPDLVVANYSSNSISIYRNNSTTGTIGSTSFLTKVDFVTGGNPRCIALGDIDGDGKTDIAVSNENSNTIGIFRNISTSGSITTASFSSRVDLASGNYPASLTISDIDIDGKPDLVVSNYGNNNISIFRNNCIPGSITTSSFSSKVDFTVGSNPWGLVIGDIDGDKKPDIAVANNAGGSVSVLKNTSSPGTITTSSLATKVDFPSGNTPYYLTISDIDGDYKPELIVTNYNSNTSSVFRNISSIGSITTSSFSPKVDITTGANPYNVCLSDIDGDGKADMVIINTGASTVGVFKNKSSLGAIVTGSFATRVDYGIGTPGGGLVVGDFDGDGKPDIAAPNYGSNTWSVIRNNIQILTAPTIGIITHPTCSVATGSVVLNGLPSTGTWTITKTPGGTTTTGSGISTTITGLTAGTYSFTVTNESSVTSVASADVVINAQPATPSAPVVGTITQPTCALATGSVYLSGLPASGTWTLTRTPGGTTTTGTGATTTVSGLSTNTYTYTVSNGSCTSASSASIVINTQPLTPSAPVVGTITQPTCSVATGSVALSGLPATGTWTLTLSPGGTITTGTGTTKTITGLAANTYTYTVSNGSCTSVASANIVINAQAGAPSAPVVGTITQPTCTIATGSVALSGLPATGTWTLTRTPGGTITTGSGTSTTISGLDAGTYSYTVTNAAACISAASANIVVNAQPVTPAAPVVGTLTQPTCALATGSVLLSGLPATGTWTLTLTPGGAVNTGTGTTKTVSGLTAGTYSYTVTNESLCTSATSGDFTINAQPVTPSAPVIGTITQPTCALATGSVAISGLPATGTWTLTRSPGGTVTTGTGTTTTISALASGTYTYTVTNSAPCTSVASAQIVINTQPVTPAAPVNGTVTHPTCVLATGSVAFSGLPATGSWTITRTPGGIATAGTGASATVSGIAEGTYTFTVTNADGCTSVATGSVVINSQPPTSPAPSIGTIVHPTCLLSTGSIQLTGLPSTGNWTVTRTPGAVSNSGTGTSITLTLIPAGSYIYTVTNSYGCISVASAGATVNAQPVTPTVPVIGTVIQPSCLIPTGTIPLSGLPATGTWTLTPLTGSPVNFSGATYSISSLNKGTYRYTVTNSAGCTSASTADITINDVPVGVIPVIAKKWSDVLICYNLNNKIDKYQWFNGTTPLTGETTQQFYWANKQAGSYKVLTTDKDGCKNYSNTIVLSTGSKSISAFPNPARENVSINIVDDPIGKTVISIFNQTGTKVMEIEADKEYETLIHELSVEDLDEGIYYVRVTVDQVNVYNTKIVVVK